MPTNRYDGINQADLNPFVSWTNEIGAVAANPQSIEQAGRLYSLLQNAQANSTAVLNEQVFNAHARNWGPGTQIPYELLRCSNCGMQVRGSYLPGDLMAMSGAPHDCKVMHEIRARQEARGSSDRFSWWPYTPTDEEAFALGINLGDPIWCVSPASDTPPRVRVADRPPRAVQGVQGQWGQSLPERIQEEMRREYRSNELDR